MATGDIRNNLERLKRELVQIRFQGDLDVVGMRLGDPAAFLPVLHYCMVKFSRHVASDIAAGGLELQGKSDARFLETAFKVFRDVFGLKPVLSAAQFLEQGYSERKVILVTDVVKHCKRQHQSAVRRQRLAAAKPIRDGSPKSQKENAQAKANAASTKGHLPGDKAAAKDARASPKPWVQPPIVKRNHAAEHSTAAPALPSEGATAHPPSSSSNQPPPSSRQAAAPQSAPEPPRQGVHQGSQRLIGIPSNASAQPAFSNPGGQDRLSDIPSAMCNNQDYQPSSHGNSGNSARMHHCLPGGLMSLPGLVHQDSAAWGQAGQLQQVAWDQQPALPAGLFAADKMSGGNPARVGPAAVVQSHPIRMTHPGSSDPSVALNSAAVARPGWGEYPMRVQGQTSAANGTGFHFAAGQHPAESTAPPLMQAAFACSGLPHAQAAHAAHERSHQQPSHGFREAQAPAMQPQANVARLVHPSMANASSPPCAGQIEEAEGSGARQQGIQRPPSQGVQQHPVEAGAKPLSTQQTQGQSAGHEGQKSRAGSLRLQQHQRPQSPESEPAPMQQQAGEKFQCNVGKADDHARDVLAARVTLLEGRVRFLEGKLQAMQERQEASQAHPESNAAIHHHQIAPSKGLGQPDTALQMTTSPHMLAIDCKPAAADIASPDAVEISRPSRIASSTPPHGRGAAHPGLVQSSPATPGSAVKSGAAHSQTRAEVKSAGAEQTLPVSWAQHASRMSQKSPLHRSTVQAASLQDSPASGQSTQDLIEGIESRYQQARAILRSYQR
ncbi:hypothetical protein WJX74_004136 [Apatococcus lobatus]|uniref:Centrosomal protein of 44 kDa n=1 Tax=Apatococcus lobatus TaxID=904363 RepID=A0AAW1RPS5_9CHLO